MDLSGNVIPEFKITQNKYSAYSLTPTSTGWFMHNNKIYLVNNKVIEKVLLNALFDNPEAIHSINCPASGTNCPEYFAEEFPIDADLVDPMYRMTLELLSKSYSFPNDIENNAKDVETVQADQ